MKTLVIYYYNETSITLANLTYFLKHGLIENPNYHFIFVINNSKCAITINETENIKVINTLHTNPLTVYSEYFLTISSQYLSEFKYFYFINSICIGPFLPPYIDINWIEIFNKLLVNNDLIAPIVEIPPDNLGYSLIGINSDLNMPFLHCYMFGTNSSSILLLLNIFKDFTEDSDESLVKYERLLTSRYLVNNKRLSSLLIAFKNIDINDKNLWYYKLWNKNNNSCYESPDNYFGLDVNPFEVLFINNIKENMSRFLRSQLKNYIVWS